MNKLHKRITRLRKRREARQRVILEPRICEWHLFKVRIRDESTGEVLGETQPIATNARTIMAEYEILSTEEKPYAYEHQRGHVQV